MEQIEISSENLNRLLAEAMPNTKEAGSVETRSVLNGYLREICAG
jgi:hypothetical protein